MRNIKRQETKTVMVRAVPSRRAWSTVAHTLEIVHCLPQPPCRLRLGNIRSKTRHIRWDVEDRPVTPRAARRVRIVANQNEALCPFGRPGPIEWRRDIGANAGVLVGNSRSVRKRRAREFEQRAILRKPGRQHDAPHALAPTQGSFVRSPSRSIRVPTSSGRGFERARSHTPRSIPHGWTSMRFSTRSTPNTYQASNSAISRSDSVGTRPCSSTTASCVWT